MKRIQNTFWILLGVTIIGCLIYKITKNSFTEHFLGDAPQHTKAIIIDEKNFMGNQPVAPKFSYSYQFVIEGQKYNGNAHDTTLKIGDSVEVEYNKDHPGINKPLYPKE